MKIAVSKTHVFVQEINENFEQGFNTNHNIYMQNDANSQNKRECKQKIRRFLHTIFFFSIYTKRVLYTNTQRKIQKKGKKSSKINERLKTMKIRTNEEECF